MNLVSNKDFLNRLYDKFPTLIAQEEYKGIHVKIKFECKICGYVWESTPATILYHSTGCRCCARKRRRNNQTMSHIDFIEKFNNINLNILIIGKYVNSKVKIKVKCLKCNYEWEVIPNNLLKGKGCPNCRNIANKNKFTMSNEEFLNKFNKLKLHIKILEKYNGIKNDIKVQCLVCNKIYITTPERLLKKQECSCLKNEKIKKANSITNDEFLKLLAIKNKNVEALEKYNNSHSKMLFKCKLCNSTWRTIPYLITHGYGCPICGKSKSKGEIKIAQTLDKYNISYDIHYKFKDLRGIRNGLLSYDFYISDYNLLIEYQGQYHDGTAGNQTSEQFLAQQEHDRRKYEYAKNNNIKLLAIWYYDYKNIEEILNNTLRPLTSIVD